MFVKCPKCLKWFLMLIESEPCEYCRWGEK
jgi:hypothetical protein